MNNLNNKTDLVIPSMYFILFSIALLSLFSLPLFDSGKILIALLYVLSLFFIGLSGWFWINKGILYSGIIDYKNIFNHVKKTNKAFEIIRNKQIVNEEIREINPKTSIILVCIFMVAGIICLLITIYLFFHG